ncbi:MAG: hypothetical protein QY312_04410 [Candidatus Dojkabacteria bacterium]|nr:MAG: hypothetical protein QY312_04410 [Candidatus Dojkabacteria bacterium]
MATINLLPKATTTDFKKADTSLKGLVVMVVWIGVLIVIFVGLFFNKSLENSRLKEVENERTRTLNQIQQLADTHDDYYTLAYKSLVLSRIKTEQYVPSTIGEYIKENIEQDGKVSQYYFDAQGDIRVQIVAKSYYSAVWIWHQLLKDKDVVQELNLTSFSLGEEGEVSFQLRGKLNLEELYKIHGIDK